MTSDDLQCCFIHIPKTAGTSIGKLLLDDLNAYDNKCHLTLQPYLRYPDYYKFTFIRNPWDRIVSYYYEKQLHPASGASIPSPSRNTYIYLLALQEPKNNGRRLRKKTETFGIKRRDT